MKRPENLVPRMAFAGPLIAMPLILAVASALATPQALPLQDEDLPETGTIEAPEQAERMYVPFLSDIIVTLPRDGGQIKINIGVALRKSEGAGLLNTLKTRAEALQAELATVVLEAAEALNPDETAEDFRAELPSLLRDSMNRRLITLGQEPAVLEVLITEWAIAR